jgi:hypothetical protein
VERGQPLGGASHDREGLGDGAPGAPEAGPEVLADQPLHRQVRLASAREAVGDVADDRGVAHLGEGPGFVFEPGVITRGGVA